MMLLIGIVIVVVVVGVYVILRFTSDEPTE